MSSRFRSAWGHPPMCGFLAIIAATTLLACSGGTEPTATPLAPAVGLSISPTGLSLIVGHEARLTARAFNSVLFDRLNGLVILVAIGAAAFLIFPRYRALAPEFGRRDEHHAGR